jgi:predicted MFS family arabinose efflux permease
MTTILAVYGAGATLAALWLAHGGATRISSTLVLRSYVVYACAIAALVLMGNLWLAAAAALLWGIAGQIRSTGTIALLQTSIPDAQRGRVMGTEFLFSRIAGGIGTYLVGAAAERHGLQMPMLVAAAVCVLAWGYAYMRRRAIQSSFIVLPPNVIETKAAP